MDRDFDPFAPAKMTVQAALMSVVESMLVWCERTGNDVLSTFDITDEVWDIVRPVVKRG